MNVNNSKPNPREIYADIIDLPHHESKTHPRMSMQARAAQFAPFAALSGYDAMVKEAARETEQKKELSDEEMRVLNQKLAYLRQLISTGHRPEVSIKVFIPDAFKSGGRYDTVSGIVKKVDTVYRRIVLFGENSVSDGVRVKIDDVMEIHGAAVDYLDD